MVNAVFYLDTSALVKRYRTEQGTEIVQQLFDNPSPEDRFFISFFSIIELTSGILRLAKGGHLSQDTANQILARFRRDVQKLFRLWPLNDDIAVDAVTVVEEHRLRSADAIHLATAQRVASLASPAQVIMVSSDRELLDAAAVAGLHALDPQARGSAEKLDTLRGR
jgi:predicted nucleic acid-binding protein